MSAYEDYGEAVTREEFPPTRREEFPPARREEYPPTRREEYPPTRGDEFPPTRREEYPPTRGDEFPPTTREEFPPTRREEYPPTRREEYPPTRRDEYPPTTREEYPPTTREEYPTTREEFPPTRREEFHPTKAEEFPPGMAPKILGLLKNLKQLEENLKPLTAKPYHEILSKLSPLEKSKVGLMEVYGINSLFWVLMRTSGEDVDSTLKDDYRIEMNRLKELQSRLAEVEARASRTRIDRRAAGRFIKHGLGISTRRQAEEDDDDIEEIPTKRKKSYLGCEVKEECPEEEHNTRFVESWQ